MNCEKCKNNKASLFFSDEEGKRHALCAACGATYNKLGELGGTATPKEAETIFLPPPTLYGYMQDGAQVLGNLILTEGNKKCPTCHTSIEEIIETGEISCPHCYTAFFGAENTQKAKMPRSRRRAIEQKIKLDDLRSRLKSAVSAENYELAARLRDQIKSIESSG